MASEYLPSAMTPLCHHMQRRGSDKATFHNYTRVYHHLFQHWTRDAFNLLEIGIGSIDASVPSNMGPNGTPGASLRGWRDYFPKANVLGADIDPQTMFSEDRISTCVLDQRSPHVAKYLDGMKSMFPSFRVIVDDGLHDGATNLHVMKHLLPRLDVGGYYVIEDIRPDQQPIFSARRFYPEQHFPSPSASAESQPRYRYEFCHLAYSAPGVPTDNCLFIVQRTQ